MNSSSEKSYNLLPQEEEKFVGKVTTATDIKHGESCETVYLSCEELHDLKATTPPECAVPACDAITGKEDKPPQLLYASLWIGMVLHLLTRLSTRNLVWLPLEEAINHIYVLYDHVCIQTMLAGVVAPPIDQLLKDSGTNTALVDVIQAVTTLIGELQERVDTVIFERLRIDDIRINTKQQDHLIQIWLHNLPPESSRIHFRAIIREERRRLKQLFYLEFTLWNVVLLVFSSIMYLLDIVTDYYSAAFHFCHWRFAVATITVAVIWIAAFVVAACNTHMSNFHIVFFTFVPLLPVFDNWTSLQLGLQQRRETSPQRKLQLFRLRSQLTNTTMIRKFDEVSFESEPQFILQLVLLLRLRADDFRDSSWYELVPGIGISALLIGWSYTTRTYTRLVVDNPWARLPCLLFNAGYYGSLFTSMALFYSTAPVWLIVSFLLVRCGFSLVVRIVEIKSPDESVIQFLRITCYDTRCTLLLFFTCGMFYLFEPFALPNTSTGVKFCVRVLDVTAILALYSCYRETVNWLAIFIVYGLITTYAAVGRLNRRFQFF